MAYPGHRAEPFSWPANHTVAIEDVEYQKGMLARLYRKGGAELAAAAEILGRG